MFINSGENIWSITKETIDILPITNHEEADKWLIFDAGMSKDTAVNAAKDTDVFLLLIYALSQWKYFLSSRYKKINSNQFINISMIYDNLGVKYLMSFQNCILSPVVTLCNTKFHFEKVHVFRIVCKDPSNLILIKMLGLNTTLTEKLSKRQKTFVQL